MTKQVNNVPPIPSFPDGNKQGAKKSKLKRNLCIAGGAVVAWFILAHFFGPDSAHSVNKKAEDLRNDSIALQQDFSLSSKAFETTDVALEALEDLGNPFRYGDHGKDSVRMVTNPETASLVEYNIKRANEIKEEVLPSYRRQFALEMGDLLRADNEMTVVKFADSPNTAEHLLVYSPKYFKKDNITKDYHKYVHYLSIRGYKSITFAPSPENEGTKYSFN